MNNAKTWFWVILSALMVTAIINVIFFVMPMLTNLKDSFSPARTLVVSAQGTATATPDQAQITFSVVTQGADPTTLSNNNNTKMNSVMQFLASQDIATSDIATTNYDMQPNYDYRNGTQSITGYTLTQTVQVKINDLTKVASTLGGLAPLGVNEVGNVEFTFQNPNAPLDNARMDAMSNAQSEAQSMASAAGAKLGPVVAIQEASNTPYPQPMYAMASGAPVAMNAATTPNLQPGTQNVTDNVTVTYQLQ